MTEILGLVKEGVSILSILSVGGILGSFISLKYKSKVENAKAEEAESIAELKEIHNTAEIVKLYKEALDYSRKETEEVKSKYQDKLDELTQKIESQSRSIDRLQLEVNNKDSLIEELTRNQLKFKLEVESLRSNMVSTCESCEFKNECTKYKAKCLIK